ncbi:MAG: hypothetical protein EPN88_03390 [Bacteroidetes bacterium]|nr:MAG: hypothetical protein EPN88_03390 [Bacteroidota bacterium]
MDTKNDLIEQSNLAFDFIQKLYLETSYLIKQVESVLSEEPEEFLIGKPGGYGVTSRGSSGLESNYVKQWTMRKFAVFFTPRDKTDSKGGVGITPVTKDLKILYLRIVLNDESEKEPKILIGSIYDIHSKKGWEKFEQFMGHIEYYEHKIFKNPSSVNYNDTYISFKGEFIKRDLFDITDSSLINSKIIQPGLNIYRKQRP